MITVVTCIWQRPERLMYTLRQLEAQTHQEFEVHLVLNNAPLQELVEAAMAQVNLRCSLTVNPENRGAFARYDVMHQLAETTDWFMTLDDDLTFDRDLIERWHDARTLNTIQGFRGFRFGRGSTYWSKQVTPHGRLCHFLYGGNTLVPAAVMLDKRVLEIQEQHRYACDDLWFSYYCQHVRGYKLKSRAMPIAIEKDGKDTFQWNRSLKAEYLEELRGLGWDV